MGTTFDPAIAGQMAQTVSREYRAMGITLELGPQVDLASDPRWNRMSATFGSDPQLNADMARAVCDGLQTTPDAPESARGWGRHSVLAMTKHWPGSTGEGGRESHKESGKYAVYPGGNFDSHLYPWTAGAFCLDGPTSQCGAVMSCYDSIWEIGGKDANLSGASFNPYIINKLLREKYHFDGFVCTDFWITGNLKKERTTRPQVNAWGYEKVSAPERALREWESGVDQCGGTNEIEVMREAYQLALQKHGPAWAEQRINEIAERILTFGFRVGSFDNPYADPVYAHDFVGNQQFRSLGMDAHRKSIILLKNRNILPLKKGAKVWVAEKYEGGIPDRAGNISPATLTSPLSQEETAGFFTRADNPESADFALVFMDSPKSGDGFDDKTGEYLPISLQYHPYTADTAREENISGNFTDGVKQNRSYRGKTVTTYNEYDLDQLLKVRQQMNGKPVILVLTCANPAVPAEFEPCADAILVGFAGTPNQILLEAVCGCFEPSGLLPFQMPASMETVEAHSEDTPGDMIPYTDEAGHVWDFGFGMNWNGVICDERLKKYCKGK
ncbi:MAG: glycoside hydrolase family 3 C-terminal domain-containing protein [Lachnospiraceae bacterium]|nr:glycoside hydrolase family 3 C-terminal domain-containing protein [Lachnospiraceae bacterium]